MDQATEKMGQGGAPIRSALLTTGSGPLANSACRALLEYTDLRGVILSRSREVERRWKKLPEYGGWYALQYITSRIMYLASNNRDIRRILPTHVGIRTWERQHEEHDLVEWLVTLGTELVVVCGLQYILTRDLIRSFKYCINIHPSLLPNYRGPEPIIWGLLDKNPAFGITLHLLDEGVDTGDIICQTEVRRPTLPLSFAVQMRLAEVLPDLIRRTIEQIQAGELHTCRQERGFYLSLPTLANRRIRGQRQPTV